MKQVNLNGNSWHTKYYRWITSSNPPDGLCPYFWSMVAFIVLSPLLVIVVSLAHLLVNAAEKKSGKTSNKVFNVPVLSEVQMRKRAKSSRWWKNFWEVVGKVILGLFILFIVFIIVMMFAGAIHKFGCWKTIIGFFAIIGTLSLMILIAFVWFNSKIGSKIIKSKMIQIPRAAIYGFYKKSCPRIIWNNKSTAKN